MILIDKNMHLLFVRQRAAADREFSVRPLHNGDTIHSGQERHSLSHPSVTGLEHCSASTLTEYSLQGYCLAESSTISSKTKSAYTLAKIVLNDLALPSVSALPQLYWLPINRRINFIIAILTYRALQSGTPS